MVQNKNTKNNKQTKIEIERKKDVWTGTKENKPVPRDTKEQITKPKKS